MSEKDRLVSHKRLSSHCYCVAFVHVHALVAVTSFSNFVIIISSL